MTHDEAIALVTAPGGDYELEAIAIVGGERCRVFKNAPGSIRDLLLGTREFADYTYLVYEDESYTFGEVFEQTAKLAWLLREEYGVGPGDRVALCMRNYPEYPAAFLATCCLGAVAAPMNGWWSGPEMEYALTDSGAKVLIADRQRMSRVGDRLPELGISGITVRTSDNDGWGDVLEGRSETELPPCEIDPDQLATLFYTSGSTGHPKGVPSTHRNITNALLSWEVDNRAYSLRNELPTPKLPYELQLRFLVTIPFFHVTASHACFFAGLRSGHRLYLMYKWDEAEALETIEREEITHVVTVPTISGDIVRAAAAQGKRLPSLLGMGGGGAARPSQQVREIDSTFENCLPSTGWGMTETNAIGSTIRGRDYLDRPMSSGRRSVVMDFRVVDENGNDADRGELLVKGTVVVKEYWNKRRETAETFVDGWMRTGDVVTFDDDGFIYIVDRVKDIVIRAGENISCTDVENAICEHPDVAEAVACGVPDERLGEELVAVVRPKDGRALSDDALSKHLDGRLAKFEKPTRFVFREDPIPRIATGKFARRQLRDEIAAADAAGI